MPEHKAATIKELSCISSFMPRRILVGTVSRGDKYVYWRKSRRIERNPGVEGSATMIDIVTEEKHTAQFSLSIGLSLPTGAQVNV